ncbi:hypothetical protein JMJ77_0004993, partial [Colletotrichum scovillei]
SSRLYQGGVHQHKIHACQQRTNRSCPPCHKVRRPVYNTSTHYEDLRHSPATNLQTAAASHPRQRSLGTDILGILPSMHTIPPNHIPYRPRKTPQPSSTSNDPHTKRATVNPRHPRDPKGRHARRRTTIRPVVHLQLAPALH